ncbi:hypothetical protein BBJ28_00012350 [Nothophytophthora sp. Chile5]|nr:hypothetical protein BBJ28_00012350 [Nothophytophthora sp. Chile5]
MSKTWESIDAFYLPQKDVPAGEKVPVDEIVEWNRENRLLLFQMTVSATHDVNTSGIMHMLRKLDLLKSVESDPSRVVLAFVVPNARKASDMLHEKTFKRLWRELTAAGWKARKPRGLSVDYSYVMPGITGRLDDSKRGMDFFVEQGDGGGSAGQDNTEYTTADDEDEEKKSESDGDVNPLDEYDGDQFMDAMRRDNALGPTSPDDINLLSTSESDTDQSDAEDEGVMADNETEDESDEEEEIEDITDSNDQDVGEVTFDMTDDQLKEIAVDGWETYDEDHCGPRASRPWPLQRELGYWNGKPKTPPPVSVPTLLKIQDEMKRFKTIKPHEIVHVIALLVARSISPVRDGLAKHWSTTEDGAIPRGTFSRFMKRERFETILRFLHLNDNQNSAAHLDKAIEVYCGKPANNQKEKNVGPKAVVRNITKVLHGQPAKRLVITDNYYSSVALSLKLHDIGFYHVGTVRTHRLGWCKPIQYKQKKRPKKMPRGQYKIAQCKTRQYLCKVCSAFADPMNKSFETSYHCPRCSEYFGGRVPLCRQVRRVESGNTLTCAQIWHDTWNDGKNIPPSLKKKIRFRKGKRKRTGAEEEEESS